MTVSSTRIDAQREVDNLVLSDDLRKSARFTEAWQRRVGAICQAIQRLVEAAQNEGIESGRILERMEDDMTPQAHFHALIRDPVVGNDVRISVRAKDEALALHGATVYAQQEAGRSVVAIAPAPALIRVDVSDGSSHVSVRSLMADDGWEQIS